jgi:tRNA A37 threonylcarbamoyladenosine biosynthesis protein TsaE
MFSIYFYFKDYVSFNKFSIILSRCYLLNTAIFLLGNFGVGKTFFSKGLLGEILNYKYTINSSSFSKVNVFFLNGMCFYHVDFYDFVRPYDVDVKLFKFLSDENFFLLTEWGEKLLYKITPDIYVYIFFYSIFSRFVIIKSYNINIIKLFL